MGWHRAQATVQRAVALEPNSVDARYVQALLLMAMDRLDEAVSAIDYAARLDPLSAQVTRPTVACCTVHGGSRRRAFASSERSNWSPEPRDLRATREVHEQWGAMTTRSRPWTRWTRSRGVPRRNSSGARARILALAGRTKEAVSFSRTCRAEPQRAETLAALGDHDAAFTSLFRALDERDSWLLFIKSDPISKACIAILAGLSCSGA